MKKKHFYSHIVETSDLTLAIAELNVDSKERVHLLSLAEANIHSTIVSDVLGNLSDEDKKTFLKNLSEDDHDKTWEHLAKSFSQAEDKIRLASAKVIRELIEDINKAKEIK
jgi:hypothetical protein